MLVEIVVENFFSFKDEATFSMVASPIGEHPESVYGKNNIAVTKLATIYGANGSVAITTSRLWSVSKMPTHISRITATICWTAR